MRNSYLVVGIVVVLLVIIIFAAVRTRLPQFGRLTSPTPTPVVLAPKDEIAVSVHTPAKTAVIDKVTLQKNGFVAVHEEKEGLAAGIIGASALLSAGTHENITIELVRKSLANEKLIAMLHYDNADGNFDPATDEPAKDANDIIIQAAFQVSSDTTGFQIPATGLGQDSE